MIRTLLAALVLLAVAAASRCAAPVSAWPA